MGERKIRVMQSAANSISDIAWFIESKGLVATAEKFSDDIYDFFEKFSNNNRNYALCRDDNRASLGFKCIPYKKKYTVVFIETESEITICEFIPSKLIK
jgi:plasmid stabilization system protein ParE